VGSSIGSAVAGAGTLSDAAFVAADAAQLAGQGLSKAAIAETLVSTGVSSATASTAASLAASGATEAAISSSLGSGSLFAQPTPPTDYSRLGGTSPEQLASMGETGLISGTPGVSEVFPVAPPGGTAVSLPPQAAGASLAAGAPIVNATPVPAGELAFPAREVAANYTPVPGSFQAALPGLGVETAASAAPYTAAAGSFQAALPSLLNPAASSGLLSVSDALRGMNLANQLMGGGQQTATGFPQQQSSFQPTGVDYSGIYGLLGQRPSVPGISSLLGPAQLRFPSLLG
jgi:hypothetical protein